MDDPERSMAQGPHRQLNSAGQVPVVSPTAPAKIQVPAFIRSQTPKTDSRQRAPPQVIMADNGGAKEAHHPNAN